MNLTLDQARDSVLNNLELWEKVDVNINTLFFKLIDESAPPPAVYIGKGKNYGQVYILSADKNNESINEPFSPFSAIVDEYQNLVIDLKGKTIHESLEVDGYNKTISLAEDFRKILKKTSAPEKVFMYSKKEEHPLLWDIKEKFKFLINAETLKMENKKININDSVSALENAILKFKQL